MLTALRLMKPEIREFWVAVVEHAATLTVPPGLAFKPSQPEGPTMGRLMTLKEVAPLARITITSAYGALAQGKFPIRHVAKHPYRFAAADVRKYVEDGEVTNEALRVMQRRPRALRRRRSLPD